MSGTGPADGATFRDHFSGASASYAEFRPTYPSSLFAELARRAPAHELAWDCGTGSGQAARGLVEHFARVIGTDPSAQQLASAVQHERIEYRRSAAEDGGLDSGSADLVAVAQALHWFDRERFFAEARRVLVPNGVLAVWGYGTVHIHPDIDAELDRFYSIEVGAYWPPERRLVDERYSSLELPFEEIVMPSFAIERDLTLPELAGYLRTWSATQRYIRATGVDPVNALEHRLAALWGDPAERRHATWPIFMRVGRKVQASDAVRSMSRPATQRIRPSGEST